MSVNLGEAALALIRPNGLRPAWKIFPLGDWDKQGSKIPRKGSHGHNDATDQENTIRAWWKQFPNANIGLATGERNNLVVIDIDMNHNSGANGEETFERLERINGRLPPTVEALTPAGGRHLFFRYPSGHRIGCIKDPGDITYPWPGIDIRGNGGYVVVAPSMRVMDTGEIKSYQWELSSVPEEVKIAELPPLWVEWLENWLSGSDGILKCKQFSPPDTVPQGERNNTIFRFCCSLRGYGFESEEMRKRVEEYNSKHCVPPLEKKELEGIFHSVERYPIAPKRPASVDANSPYSGRGRPVLTIESLAEELKSRGLGIRFNQITMIYEPVGITEAGKKITLDNLITRLHSDLKTLYRGATSADILRSYMTYIGFENAYNPVLDLISSTPWDEIDRIPQVFQILGIEDDPLSQDLVRNWLLQTVALLFNEEGEPFGADGILVLNGKQGWGKTSFFRRLALNSDWFEEGGSIDEYDKDKKRRVVTKWIAELGEVEYTLKSDVCDLKNFITAARDEYRLPYGRSDITAPRHTSLCATCNSEKYLVDETGNRRWWSVPVARRITQEDLEKLDPLQLWAQIYEQIAPLSYDQKRKCFRLSVQMAEALAERNGDFEKDLPGEMEVADILERAERDNLPWETMTILEFKNSWRTALNATIPLQKLATAIRLNGIETKRGKHGMTAKLPKNPFSL